MEKGNFGAFLQHSTKIYYSNVSLPSTLIKYFYNVLGKTFGQGGSLFHLHLKNLSVTSMTLFL